MSPSSRGGSQGRPGFCPTRAGSAARPGGGDVWPGPGAGRFLGVTAWQPVARPASACCGAKHSPLFRGPCPCVCVCVLCSLSDAGEAALGPSAIRGHLSSRSLTAGEATASRREEQTPSWARPPQDSSADEDRDGGVRVQGRARPPCALPRGPKVVSGTSVDGPGQAL